MKDKVRIRAKKGASTRKRAGIGTGAGIGKGQVRKRAEERKRESEPVLASVRRLGGALRLPEHRNLDG